MFCSMFNINTGTGTSEWCCSDMLSRCRHRPSSWSSLLQAKSAILSPTHLNLLILSKTLLYNLPARTASALRDHHCRVEFSSHHCRQRRICCSVGGEANTQRFRRWQPCVMIGKWILKWCFDEIDLFICIGLACSGLALIVACTVHYEPKLRVKSDIVVFQVHAGVLSEQFNALSKFFCSLMLQTTNAREPTTGCVQFTFYSF